MAARKTDDPFKEWCYNEPVLLTPDQLNELLQDLSGSQSLGKAALQHTLEGLLTPGQASGYRAQAADQLAGEPGTKKSDVGNRAMDLAVQDAINQLVKQGLLEQKNEHRYVPNQRALCDYLAQAAFDRAEELLTGKRFNPRGAHQTCLAGIERILYDRVERSPRTTRGISPTHTLRNSLARRAVDPTGPLLSEDDLVRRKTRKEDVAYHVIVLLDLSGSMYMAENKAAAAVTATLSLGHYMQRKHRKDKLDVIVFDDRTRHVPLEKLPFVQCGGGTATHAALARARRLAEEERKRETLVYLVTDGEPNDVNAAIDEAWRLHAQGAELIEILLSKDDWQVRIGKAIAEAAEGTLVHVPDPSQLGAFFIEQYAVAKGQKRL